MKGPPVDLEGRGLYQGSHDAGGLCLREVVQSDTISGGPGGGTAAQPALCLSGAISGLGRRAPLHFRGPRCRLREAGCEFAHMETLFLAVDGSVVDRWN